MLTKKPNKRMIEMWKKTFEIYKDKIIVGAKSKEEMLEYLNQNFVLSPFKILDGEMAYYVENQGKGKLLYENQDKVFRSCKKIIVYIKSDEICQVEGSSYLWDEMFLFRGLSESDAKNYFLVAEYIDCLKRFGRLSEIDCQ